MGKDGAVTEEMAEATDGEPQRSSSTRLRIGATVAETYRIIGHIGSGGSSHVFEAEHVRLGKPFAVKLLRPELDPSRRAAQRFRREARAIARLNSEHIVSVIDCGELEDGTPYLVMERLDGEDLRDLLNREGSLPVRRAVEIIVEACRGLSIVHAAGLVHRDLKPENLFITRRSTGEDWCKVLDFGVAKMEASLATAENAIVGTARYMAPEQLSDSAGVSPTTDVYGLGAILYECIAGRPLVTGSTVQEVMYQIMNAEPVPLSELVPTLPQAVGEVVQECVRKSPTARPSSTADLARRLQVALVTRAPGSKSNDTLVDDDELPKPQRKSRRAVLAVAVAAVAASAATGAAGWFARAAVPAPIAEQPSTRSAAAPAPPPAVFRSSVDAAPGTAIAKKSLPAPAVSPSMSPGKAPRILSPQPPAAAVPRRRVADRFDTTNPYTE